MNEIERLQTVYDELQPCVEFCGLVRTEEVRERIGRRIEGCGTTFNDRAQYIRVLALDMRQEDAPPGVFHLS